MQRSLGSLLRAIVLATPVIEGCFGSKGVDLSGCASGPQQESPTFALTDADGGEIDAGGNCSMACADIVHFSVDSCAFVTLDSGEPGVSCNYVYTPTCYGLGRRPASLLECCGAAGAGLLGDHFAQAARLEAASARAFQVLARELVAHAAPATLVRAARRSVGEEVRHARATRRLARRFGGTPLRAHYGGSPPVRSLEDIAVENAIEGCVRETYGAAIAWWQARHSCDRGVARAMARIAVDETRHAQLSWDIAAWAEPRLPRAARTRVTRARAQAVAALRAQVDRDVAPDLVTTAGLPPRTTAHELLRRLESDVLGGA